MCVTPFAGAPILNAAVHRMWASPVPAYAEAQCCFKSFALRSYQCGRKTWYWLKFWLLDLPSVEFIFWAKSQHCVMLVFIHFCFSVSWRFVSRSCLRTTLRLRCLATDTVSRYSNRATWPSASYKHRTSKLLHGLSQQGICVPFWTPKPLKSTPQDTHIFLWRISKNVNLKHIIEFFHLNIIPMILYKNIMPYFDKFIHVYGWIWVYVLTPLP